VPVADGEVAVRRISLYGHVIELLAMVESSREPADQLAGRFLRERRYLGSRDRRFISELYFDILRNRALLEFHARQGMSAARNIPGDPPVGRSRPELPPQGPSRPELHQQGPSRPELSPQGPPQPGPSQPGASPRTIPPIALLTAHQLHLAGEDPVALYPDIADLWRMVGATGDLAPTIDAIRASAIPPAILADAVAGKSLRHSIAPDIVREWVERFGDAAADELCRASNTPAPTTIRVNTLKCTREECREALAREGVAATPTRYSPVGLVLEKRVNTGALEAYRTGMFEMQDEGSQLVSMLAGPAPGSVIVDACAGAGGKSLHIAAIMNGEGTIHAFDTDPVRLRSLRTRARRSGTDIIRDAIVAADAGPDPVLSGTADLLLVDAPCSGVGTYRRNPGAKTGFTAASSRSLSDLQLSLLERYCGVVRPGGRIVYATCTLLRRENEGVVELFLGAHTDFHPVHASRFLSTLGLPTAFDPFMLLLPHQTGTDGFFAAVLERSDPPA
jgi:16S rRNA (cytosine967-C5)-methyltransferase